MGDFSCQREKFPIMRIYDSFLNSLSGSRGSYPLQSSYSWFYRWIPAPYSRFLGDTGMVQSQPRFGEKILCLKI